MALPALLRKKTPLGCGEAGSFAFLVIGPLFVRGGVAVKARPCRPRSGMALTATPPRPPQSAARRSVVRELGTLVCDRPHNLFCQFRVGEQSIDKGCEDFLAGDARET